MGGRGGGGEVCELAGGGAVEVVGGGRLGANTTEIQIHSICEERTKNKKEEQRKPQGQEEEDGRKWWVV